MSDWSLLKATSGSHSNDFLSSFGNLSNHELNKLQMMGSFMTEHSFTNSKHGSSMYDDNTFCTSDNIDECITHLNQILTGLGLTAVSHDAIPRTASLINRLEEVLRMYQRIGRINEDLEDRFNRVSCDVTTSQSNIRRLKADKERLEKELAEENEKNRQSNNKIKNLSHKLKTEKDELRRMQVVIKDRDSQYKHELRKKQREINRLMERLHQLLVDKNPHRRIGMDMVGYLHRGDSKRGTWKNTSDNNKVEEMYRVLISNYEDKQQELRVENSELRDCLLEMQRELSTILHHPTLDIPSQNERLSGSSSEEELSVTSSVSHDLNDDCFQLPYDILRENLQKGFQATCKRLRNTLTKCHNNQSISKSSRSSPSKCVSENVNNHGESERQQDEIDKLRKQIDKYKDIVKQQEQLIQQSLCTQSKSMEKTFLHESQILEEKETLSEQRRSFYQEKANFEEDRQKVAETARQLKHERKQLEEEKAALFRSQFLQVASSSPASNKPPTPPTPKDKGRLLPSTPVFSPAPAHGVASTSTDLRKYLNSALKKGTLKYNGSLDQQSLCMSGSTESVGSSRTSVLSSQSHGDLRNGGDFRNGSPLSAKRSLSLENADSSSSESAKGLRQCSSGSMKCSPFDAGDYSSGSEKTER